MTSTDITLAVALMQDEGSGDTFQRDIVSMIEAIARRLSIELEPVVSMPTERVYRVRQHQRLPLGLSQEVGVHRAQLVQPDDPTGRLVTAKVHIVAGHGIGELSRDAVLKTYNYAIRRVDFHQTGQTAPLDDVLAGLHLGT